MARDTDPRLKPDPRFRIDPKIRELLPVLTEAQKTGLEDLIVKHGCDPLVVWKEGRILLDGHHRKEICDRLGIRPEIKRRSFPSRYEAMRWVYKNQHNRRNTNDWQEVCSALKFEPELKAQAKERQGTRTDLHPDSGRGSKYGTVDKQIAEMAEVSHTTVYIVRVLLRKASDELKADLEAGTITINAAFKEWKGLRDKDQFYSPVVVIKAARKVMGGIDLDPASCKEANKRVGATRYYSLKERRQDGLKLPWRGRIWLNPPYSGPRPFIERLIKEYYVTHKVTAAVVLLDTDHINKPWFDELWDDGVLCFTIRPLLFGRPKGKDVPIRQGQVIAYVGKDKKRFEEVFSTAADGLPMGHIVKGDFMVSLMSSLSPEWRPTIDAAVARGLIPSAEAVVQKAIERTAAIRSGGKWGSKAWAAIMRDVKYLRSHRHPHILQEPGEGHPARRPRGFGVAPTAAPPRRK